MNGAVLVNQYMTRIQQIKYEHAVQLARELYELMFGGSRRGSGLILSSGCLFAAVVVSVLRIHDVCLLLIRLPDDKPLVA